MRITFLFTVPDQADKTYVLEVPDNFRDNDFRNLADTYAYLMSKKVNDRPVKPKAIQVMDQVRQVTVRG